MKFLPEIIILIPATKYTMRPTQLNNKTTVIFRLYSELFIYYFSSDAQELTINKTDTKWRLQNVLKLNSCHSHCQLSNSAFLICVYCWHKITPVPYRSFCITFYQEEAYSFLPRRYRSDRHTMTWHSQNQNASKGTQLL